MESLIKDFNLKLYALKTQLIFILSFHFLFNSIIKGENQNQKLINTEIIENSFFVNKQNIFNSASSEIKTFNFNQSRLNYNLLYSKTSAHCVFYGAYFRTDTNVFNPELNPSQTCAIDKEFMANNIYYDLNKCDIREDAAIELDKIALIMLDNEEIRVEMGAHTDARASDEYNFLLSQKRAKAALDYLIEKGVSTEKISAVGFGKTKLINICAGSSPCSEKEHQLNRRMEIKLIFEHEIQVKYTENETVKELKDL